MAVLSKSSAQPPATKESRLFTDEESTRPSLTYRRHGAPLISSGVVNRSTAWNSERATGMTKVAQLQYVEMLKKAITDNATIGYAAHDNFKVSMSRKHISADNVLIETSLHIAHLIGDDGDGEPVLLEQSRSCEFLPDAVEDLWEKIMESTGRAIEGVKVGENIRSSRRSSMVMSDMEDCGTLAV